MDIKQADKDPTRVPDEPTIKESTWLSLVLAAGLISLPVLLFLLLWSLQDSDQDAVNRLEILKLVGTACVAIVTLLTVIWRGVVSTRQADQQFKQIEQKDEENLAKLLMDGTKLISDGDEKRANVLAGIAALQAVITSPNSRFASQAIDLLGDLLSMEFPKGNSIILQKCIETLNSGADLGRISERDLELKTRMYLFIQSEDSEYADAGGYDFTDDFKWKIVGGFSSIRYFGGVFDEIEYKKIYDNKYYFEDVEFRKCVNIQSHIYISCFFKKCLINKANYKFLEENNFEKCDFSGFVFLKREGDYLGNLKSILQGRRFIDCYYYTDNPPEPLPGLVWSDYLEARDPL